MEEGQKKKDKRERKNVTASHSLEVAYKSKREKVKRGSKTQNERRGDRIEGRIERLT